MEMIQKYRRNDACVPWKTNGIFMEFNVNSFNVYGQNVSFLCKIHIEVQNSIHVTAIWFP